MKQEEGIHKGIFIPHPIRLSNRLCPPGRATPVAPAAPVVRFGSLTIQVLKASMLRFGSKQN